MTKPRNMWIIESDFFKNDRKFTDLTWSSKIVYIAMWIHAGDERMEITTWRKRSRLITHLELMTEAPRDVIDLAITECCATGLITFDGDLLTVFGLEEKHPTIKYWNNTVKNPNGINKFNSDTPPRTHLVPTSYPPRTHVGDEPEPEPEPEPEQGSNSLLHLPSYGNTQEPDPSPAEADRNLYRDGLVRFGLQREQEALILDVLSSREGTAGRKQRAQLLKLILKFESQAHLLQCADATRERLALALLYTFTRKGVKNPPGHVYEYAVTYEIPDKKQSALRKQLLELQRKD